MISFKNLLRAIENIGIVSVYGIKYLTTGNVTQENFIKYVEHDTLIWEYLNSSIHLAPYLEEKLQKIYKQEAYQFYRKRYVQLILTAQIIFKPFHKRKMHLINIIHVSVTKSSSTML